MGTWATPDTMAKARRLAKLLAKPLPSKCAADALYDLVGDDGLFDSISASHGSPDVRFAVARKLKEWDEDYHARPEAWYVTISPEVWTVLRRAYRKVLAPSRRGR